MLSLQRERNGFRFEVEDIRMLRKTMGWVAGAALAYLIINSLPDVVCYIKITRM